jgi:ubiquinone/menaquinone biosynthesis C-methylase UbiE
MRSMSDNHTHVQEFFTARAADWDTRFPDDGPAYAAAVAGMGLREGDRVLDAGCGTGRALPPLRAAVGACGVVIGADLTPAMLEAAVRAGRDRAGQLLLADVAGLPLRTTSLDAVFGAGLIAHLPNPAENLRELARVVRPGALPPDRPGGARGPPGQAAHPGGPARGGQPASAAGGLRLGHDVVRR